MPIDSEIRLPKARFRPELNGTALLIEQNLKIIREAKDQAADSNMQIGLRGLETLRSRQAINRLRNSREKLIGLTGCPSGPCTVLGLQATLQVPLAGTEPIG